MSFSVEPVGHVEGDRPQAEDDFWGAGRSRIRLTSAFPEEALRGLADFSHAEVIFLFHAVDPSRIVTGARHPREDRSWPAVGIFAQRGRNRPNRIGCTICRIVGVEGRTLVVAELDAIDGTPVLDIKPVMQEFLPRERVRQPRWSRELMKNYWATRPDVASRPAEDKPADVVIRPYERGDAAAMFGAIRESIAELEPWMPWCHPDYARAEAEAWIEQTLAGRRDGTMYDFAIIADGRFAGACGINQINALNGFANLGYWVRTTSAGRGIAARAVHQLLDWTFDNTPLHRIEIVAAIGNVRSQRVAEKVGAVREAVLASRATAYGRPSDAIMYVVLRRGQESVA